MRYNKVYMLPNLYHKLAFLFYMILIRNTMLYNTFRTGVDTYEEKTEYFIADV